MQSTESLVELYRKGGKHANYQEIPACLTGFFDGMRITPRIGRESARLNFILKHLPIKGSRIVDIGANTGYFTFGLLDAGAAKVVSYEGNPIHAEFIRVAAESVGLTNRIAVRNEYFDFERPSHRDVVNLILLMNVLHHVGDDYGQSTGVADARKQIGESLKRLATMTRHLVFQLGYNWKGNRDLPLFANGTKSEQIEFVNSVMLGFWDIVAIGIADMRTEGLVYTPPTPANLVRQDALGEFLNRPLFLCRSRGISQDEGHVVG